MKKTTPAVGYSQKFKVTADYLVEIMMTKPGKAWSIHVLKGKLYDLAAKKGRIGSINFNAAYVLSRLTYITQEQNAWAVVVKREKHSYYSVRKFEEEVADEAQAKAENLENNFDPDRAFCPLRKVAEQYFGRCIVDACGFYSQKYGRCGILILAEGLWQDGRGKSWVKLLKEKL